MTSILATARGKIFISSDQKVSCIQNLNFDDVTFLKPSVETDQGGPQNSDLSKTCSEKQNGKTSDKGGVGVVCMGVSSCGEYLGVCGENKVLTVYHKNLLGDQ